MTLRVAVIGAGIVGSRRAAVASASPRSELIAVADVDGSRASQVAREHGCHWSTDWQELVARPDVDAVVVSTVNKFLAPISIGAIQAGKHVLCEKPMGRSADEAEEMRAAAESANGILKVGFTLRFHPALRQAHAICERGEIGRLFCVRAAYGHGGRPGYDQEWRGNVDLAGGGELLDQGVHLIDLSRWFLGDFVEVKGMTPRWFWDIAPLEDNAFLLLRTALGCVASLHTSWTQWRNCFTFEVYGQDGYARVDGLGGSYGVETLTIGHRRPESGPPDEERFTFDGPDASWEGDWDDFLNAIDSGGRPAVGAVDGLAVMKVVERVYAAAPCSNVKAMVLAAGVGTRLRPVTDNVPKPMVPLGGRPLLAYTIDWLGQHGIRELVINLHHLPDVITTYFGDGSGVGARITYSYEPELLGTSGAVAACRSFFDDAPFLVVYGDNLTDCDLEKLAAFHAHNRALATIALFSREDVTQSGMVGLAGDDRITGFWEKPKPAEVFSHWVSAGVVVADPGLFRYIPATGASDFGRDVFPAALAAGEPLFGYRMSEGLWWVDSLEDYRRLDSLVASGGIAL